MEIQDMHLSIITALVLWLFTLQVEAGMNDCTKTNSCWSRNTSIIVVSVVVSTVCLAFIISIIVTIWCCCCRKGGGMLRRKSDTWSSRPRNDNNFRLTPVDMWPPENNSSHVALATRFNHERRRPEERLDPELGHDKTAVKPECLPPSYEEAMRNYDGGGNRS